jgi:hypothetical protein
LALPLAHSRSTLWSLGFGIGGAREKSEIESDVNKARQMKWVG